MIRTAVIACLLAASSNSIRAQPTIFTDFPGASLQNYSVSGNSISLNGVASWSEFDTSYRWVHFRATGMDGQNPRFTLGSPGNTFLGDLTDHRFVYSYDQQTWQFFDVNVGNSAFFAFSNDQPFTQDEVYVAYSTPYPVARTAERVEQLLTDWFAVPSPSANQQGIIDTVQGEPLWGLKITNPLSVQPKQRIVIATGNHSGEHGGTYAFEGFLNAITSDTPLAQGLRDIAEFYVYPQLDPLGRNEGFYRGNSQNPANDHNRFWNALTTGNNGGFQEIDILAAAMRTDTDSDVDFSFDFHGFFDSGPNYLYGDNRASRTVFIQELLRIEPDIEFALDNRTTPAGIFEFWAKTPAGLNSTFSFTPEFSPNMSSDQLRQLGESYAEALFVHFGRPDAIYSTTQIDELAAAVRTQDLRPELDFNKDQQLDIADTLFYVNEVLGTVVGDANLDRRFDSSDLVQVFQAGLYEDAIATNAAWSSGDWNGDAEFDSTDLVTVFQANTFQSTAVSVPEPAAASLIIAVACAIVSLRLRSNKR
ncbi:MAG: M14 family zinc carboxypeptidase [Pirellulaceae bacterium]